jgi:hypothetical protein
MSVSWVGGLPVEEVLGGGVGLGEGVEGLRHSAAHFDQPVDVLEDIGGEEAAEGLAGDEADEVREEEALGLRRDSVGVWQQYSSDSSEI